MGTTATAYHDPFVLFAFLAGFTRKVGFAAGVLILAQRQAVLVAKQAACSMYCAKAGFASASVSAGTRSSSGPGREFPYPRQALGGAGPLDAGAVGRAAR